MAPAAAPPPSAPSASPHGGAPSAAASYGAATHGGSPYGSAPNGPAVRPRKNVIGIVALVIGVVVLLSSTGSLLVQAVMVGWNDYASIGIVLGTFSLVQGVLALAAIVCGGIGLALRGRAKGAAGVGLGIGVTALWAVLGGLFYGPLVQLLA